MTVWVRVIAAFLLVIPVAASTPMSMPDAERVIGRTADGLVSCTAGRVGRYVVSAAHCGTLIGHRALWVGVSGDPRWDFAIHEGDGTEGPQPACRRAVVGEPVATKLGSGARERPVPHTGLVIEADPVVITAPILPGDSGSPVVDGRGRMLGVVWARPRKPALQWQGFVSDPLALCAVVAALDGRAPMP